MVRAQAKISIFQRAPPLIHIGDDGRSENQKPLLKMKNHYYFVTFFKVDFVAADFLFSEVDKISHFN